MMLDSLIAMGALLAIGWYLLLGARTMHSTVEDPIAKFLGLYYSTADIALLSYLVLLLLEGQGRLYQATARRVSLVVMGVGICFFATSDFTFNLLQNAGTYMEGSWVDLGWPLGLMTIGLAAYLRRFLPITPADLVEQRLRRRAERFTFSPEQLLPYLLVMILFVVLLINVYSPDKGQRDIHPVLLLATIAVVGLVVVRQILTLLENKRLTRRQADALERLEMANRRVEDQARMMTEHNAALEAGITHLKDVQARLANGNLRARAHLTGGELLPLALNLNLMADRLMRLEHMEVYTRRLTQALSELNIAIDRYRLGGPFIIPPSCNDFPEINRLLLSMGLMEKADTFRPRFSTSDPITGPTQRTVPQPTPFQARPPHQRDS